MNVSVPASLRPVARILGVILIVAAPTLGWAAWQSTVGPIASFDSLSAHRVAGDSAAYASAAYHAARATAVRNQRWHLTGFATLSLVAFGVGAIALAWSYARRTD